MIRDRQIILKWDRAADPAYLRSREWLLTNGLGGYASGTLAGIPARKYHGLFVPNLASPKGRHILISRCDEWVTIDGRRLHLGGAEFAEERFEGESHLFLKEFRLDQGIAVWTFEHAGVVFEKSIVMVHNQNTVCVQYRLLAGDALELQVRPFVSFRRHDESPRQQPGSFTLEVKRGRHEICHSDSDIVLRFGLRPGPTAFVTEELDENNFVYRIERDRGDPEFESAFSPGYLLCRVRPNQPAVFVASTHVWERLDFDAS
ncbi:MAG: glycogen debranching enzyme N-terminal domain-containing protein, partial [Steroidobacter sp.]